MRTLYTFDSTRAAMRAVKLSEASGITIRISAIPEDISSECGIAFYVSQNQTADVNHILNENSIKANIYERE